MRIRRGTRLIAPIAPPLSKKTAGEVAAQSSLYREATAERAEIMQHKWLLSERAGYDVGYIFAMYDWIAHHRTGWRKAWRQEKERKPNKN